MGVHYKIWIHEDHDWQRNKDKVKKDILVNIPHAIIVAHFYKWIIVDIGKTLPLESLLNGIPYDFVRMSSSGEEAVLKELYKG